MSTPRDHTPYQQKIIQRYYRNQGAIREQSLADLVSDLYLAATEAKKAALWKRAATLLEGLGVPESRRIALLERKDLKQLAELASKPFQSDRKDDWKRDAKEDRRDG